MNKLIAIIAVSVVTVLAAGLLFIYSGLYNVAATAPHWAVTAWVFATTMDHSVARHARGIRAPDLADTAQIARGYARYIDLCAICHGGPGLPQSDIAKGLNLET